MKSLDVLVIGGTGVIGRGIVKHLLCRGANVTTYSRGQREDLEDRGVRRLVGDRARTAEFERAFERSRYDVVIDLLCFTKSDAETTVRIFGDRCEQLQFCSTVCTYGVRVPPQVLIDETFPQEPTTEYARNKLACERVFLEAARAQRFEVTIVRPSHTYGPGGRLIDQLELDGVAWDRIDRGLPVLCSGDGLGLWQSTHRDDCGRFFAYAAQNPRTYGEAYNVTRDEVLTWRDYHRVAAEALDRPARLVFAPSAWLIRELPGRLGFLEEVTQFHGAYSSEKAKTDVPEFRASIDLRAGARDVFADLRRCGAWRDSALDHDYQRAVDKAVALGFPVVTA